MKPRRLFLSQLLSPPAPVQPPGFADAAGRLLHARHLAAYLWARSYVAQRDVLEIGVNRGYGAQLLSPTARHYVGIDLEFEHAKRTLVDAGIATVQANGQKLPLADRTVDVVVAFQLIEHVWSDGGLLAEIGRVLRPGGRLLVSTPQAKRRLLLGQIPWNDEHLREYDERSWSARLRGHFGSVEISGIFGRPLASRAERCRVWNDPFQHFFAGSWGRPWRLAGRALHRLRPPFPGLSPGEIEEVLGTSDDLLLASQFFVDEGPPEQALDLLAVCSEPGVRNDDQAPFDPAAYWRDRLASQPGLTGVGTAGAPAAWQRWLYRGKERALARLLARCGVDPRGICVLDFGCGTGRFEDFWERRGALRADGIDIVPEAIDRLQREHSGRRYSCLNIGDSTADLSAFGTPGLVTAIDVLYHIVDDEALVRAVARLCDLLPAGGCFLFTDALFEAETARHVRFRSLNQWRQILGPLGLTIVGREPVFAFNNRVPRGVRRAPAVWGFLQHMIDLPVLRTTPFVANNWAVLARKTAGDASARVSAGS